jgi:hypothetical protein
MGRLGTGTDRSELVRLAVQLIVEEVGGGARQAWARALRARRGGVLWLSQRLPDGADEDGGGDSGVPGTAIAGYRRAFLIGGSGESRWPHRGARVRLPSRPWCFWFDLPWQRVFPTRCGRRDGWRSWSWCLPDVSRTFPLKAPLFQVVSARLTSVTILSQILHATWMAHDPGLQRVLRSLHVHGWSTAFLTQRKPPRFAQRRRHAQTRHCD